MDRPPPPAYNFWARYVGGDESRAETVHYRIPGHGSGGYDIRPGRRLVGMFRYGWWPRAASPGGAALLLHWGHLWVPHEKPDRTMMRGSEDPGDPITQEEAERLVVQMGYTVEKLVEPTHLAR